MSQLERIGEDFARARAEFQRSISDAGAWRDDQRVKLNQSRLDPVLQAAADFGIGLRQAVEAVNSAERLLGK